MIGSVLAARIATGERLLQASLQHVTSALRCIEDARSDLGALEVEGLAEAEAALDRARRRINARMGGLEDLAEGVA